MKTLPAPRLHWYANLSNASSYVARIVPADCVLDWVDWIVGVNVLGDARTWWLSVATNSLNNLWNTTFQDHHICGIGGYLSYLPAGTPTGIITGAEHKFCGPGLGVPFEQGSSIYFCYSVQSSVNLQAAVICGFKRM